jgi:predicted metal-binding protein
LNEQADRQAPGNDVTIFVCVACRQGDDADKRPGRVFLDAVRAQLALDSGASIRVEPVECLAVCKRPSTVALAGDGKWTYVIGGLETTPAHVDGIIASARAYGASTNGIVPWKERPEAFRKGVVSRSPPVGFVTPGH